MLTRTDRRRFPVLLALIAALALAMPMLFSTVQAQEGSAPDKPRGLDATATHDSVTLTWDNPGDDSITGYVILRRVRVNNTGGDFSVLVSDTGTAALTYTDNTVAASLTYTYRIKAINEHGVSEHSRWFHVDTPAAPEPEEEQAAEPPDKPRGLETTATHDSVTLTWDDPQDDSITGYVILRRIPGVDPQGHFNELVSNTGTDATTYTDDTVSAETRYIYRIKAINEHGVSERSRWSHVDVPAAPEAVEGDDPDGEDDGGGAPGGPGKKANRSEGSTVLVSNVGQGNGTTGDLTLFDQAQAFTTGEAHTLTSVEIEFTQVPSNAPGIFVAIFDDDGSGLPGDLVGSLTNPTAFSVGTNEFTTSGIDLAAAKTYFVSVRRIHTQASGALQNTDSDSEDSGAASDWSIGDASLYRSSDQVSWSSWEDSKKIRINGTAVSDDEPPCTLNEGDIWCGVVDVGEVRSTADVLTGHGFVGITGRETGGLAGHPDDTMFSVGDNDYTIQGIYVGAGTNNEGALFFLLNADLSDDDEGILVLAFDGVTTLRPLDDATKLNTGLYQWGTDLDWSSTTEVTVRLQTPSDDADDPPVTLPTLSIANDSADEGDLLVFALSLSEATSGNVAVTCMATFGGGDTAVAEDLTFTSADGGVRSGQVVGTCSFRSVQDTTDEEDETFTVTLSGVSSNAQLAADPTAKGTILDDDDPPDDPVGEDLPADTSTSGVVEVNGSAVRGDIYEPVKETVTWTTIDAEGNEVEHKQIVYDFDTDWFRVVLEAGKTYRIDMQGEILAGDEDLTLRLPQINAIYDSDGDSLVNTFGRDESSSHYLFRVTFHARASGIYYIAASGESFEWGSYKLRVKDITEGD